MSGFGRREGGGSKGEVTYKMVEECGVFVPAGEGDDEDEDYEGDDDLSEEEEFNIEEVALYHELNIIIFWMKLCGLWFTHRHTRHSRYRRRPSERSAQVSSSWRLSLMWSVSHCFRRLLMCYRYRVTWPKIYNFIMVILTAIYLARSFLHYSGGGGGGGGSSDNLRDMFDANFLESAENTIWCFQCAFNASFMFWVCSKCDRLEKFFKDWANCCSPHINYRRLLRRWILGYLIVGFLFILHIFILYILEYFYFYPDGHPQLDALSKPFPPTYFARVVFIFMETLCMISYVLPVPLFVAICVIFYKEFDNFLKDFSATVKLMNAGRFLGSLRELRYRHQQLSRLLETADNIFSPFLFVAYLNSIPSICMLLYNSPLFQNIDESAPVEVVETNQLESTLYSLFAMNPVFYLCTISVGGAVVHKKAHAPLPFVHDIKEPRTLEDQHQITMFLHRLTGHITPMGFTAWRLFTIDKPSTLTIAGVFLTYFVLLVQFQMTPGWGTPTGSPSTLCPSVTCNCSADAASFNATNLFST